MIVWVLNEGEMERGKGIGDMGFAGRQGVQRGGERRTSWDESPVKVNHPQEVAQFGAWMSETGS